MKLNHFAYIYLGPQLDPTVDRTEINSKNYKLTIVGIAFDRKEQAIEVALALYAQGVQMIELCGGFGPAWISKISTALNQAIPIGGVFYGPEARQPMLDLLR